MKKKVLFVIDSLNCAGAEKSLVTLLSLLDYEEYEVDLQLFGYGGEMEKLIPKEVNLMPPLPYTTFNMLSIKSSIKQALIKKQMKMLKARTKFSLELRRRSYSNAQKARLFWQSASTIIEKASKQYDIAISYAQGVPTFYVAEKVEATKKYAWVNVSYRLEPLDQAFQAKYYDTYNQIVAVSDCTKEIFIETFPTYKNKVTVIYDINDFNLISKMAEIGESYKDNFQGIRILTVGRLANQKGYDLALKACKNLKERHINFRWYVLGKGPLEQEIQDYIVVNDLQEHFILLGVKANPYPYIKDCDIYVQTSRYEGFGLAIAEARMLNKPVVTTRFDAVYSQMIEGKNGLVVDMDAVSVCEGILNLMQDRKLKDDIINYLAQEKKGNAEELEKFYKLIS